MQAVISVKHPRILCLFLASCTFPSPPAPATGGDPDPAGDSTVDAGAPVGPPTSPPAGPLCYGTRPYTTVCLAAEVTAALSLSGTINTGTIACLPTTMGTAVGSCVLAGTSVTIQGLIAIGPRP